MTAAIDEIIAQQNLGAKFIPLFEELAFPQLSPQDIFSEVAERSPFCFFFKRFDEGTEVSYIGLQPREIYRLVGDQLEIQKPGQAPLSLPGPALESLKTQMQKYSSLRDPRLPAFQGGALGYLAYDFIRFLEPRLQKYGYFKDLESSTCDGELLVFDQLLIFDHTHKKAFVLFGLVPSTNPCSQGDLSEALTRLKELKSYYLQNFKKAKVAKTTMEMQLEHCAPSLGFAKFKTGVEKLKHHISQGDIFQAVLSDRFEFEVPCDPHEIFARLSAAPYEFYMKSDSVHRLGASPEMLVRVNARSLETHPIAGTRSRGKNASEDQSLARQLRRSPKEAAEHLMLVDLARNDLGRVAQAGSVELKEFRHLRYYPSVMHLTSKVTAKLREGLSAIDALAACFPAGTLSGAPKIRAMELIAEIESHPRGFYGGAVIALSFTGDLDSCISIRSLEIQNGLGVFQAGAGIVADSQALREYQEISHKTLGVRRAIGVTNHFPKAVGFSR